MYISRHGERIFYKRLFYPSEERNPQIITMNFKKSVLDLENDM